jgi:outer membrane protein
MKKITRVFFVLLFTILSAGVFAQGKIGYVSPDDIFEVMPETKKADSALAAFQKALQETYAENEASLNAALEKFVKDSAKMTPAVKDAKRTDLQARISELQESQQKFNARLEAEKEKQVKPIRDKIFVAIQTVSKEMGYDHILYKQSAIVFPDAADLTNAVKRKLGIK